MMGSWFSTLAVFFAMLSMIPIIKNNFIIVHIVIGISAGFSVVSLIVFFGGL